jgi:hypothetical protein
MYPYINGCPQIMTPEAVIARLEACGDVSSAQYMRSQLDEDIMACMLDVLKVRIAFRLFIPHLHLFIYVIHSSTSIFSTVGCEAEAHQKARIF